MSETRSPDSLDKATDHAGELDVALAFLRSPARSAAVTSFDHIGARDTQRLANRLHRISPGSGECGVSGA
jgi:hypothetical protein